MDEYSNVYFKRILNKEEKKLKALKKRGSGVAVPSEKGLSH